MQHYFAPGKLLLSGEYSVLKGAKAIAVPTQKGQHLKVRPAEGKGDGAHYRALDHIGNPWLDFSLHQASSKEELLVKDILWDASSIDFLEQFKLETKLDFPREWGLGSSSTFISLIADWLKLDVWDLFFKHLSGSGYDVAVAQVKKALSYRLQGPQQPSWEEVQIPSIFSETYFLYLGKKQNSAKEVARFLAESRSSKLIQSISELSEDLLKIKDLESLEDWMDAHERISAELIGLEPVPTRVLPEFGGKAKSLGAWGGDFLWLSRVENPVALEAAGYPTLLSFREMIAF